MSFRDQRPERGETGASSVEYGLIAVAIAALIVAIVFVLGDVVNDTYSESCDRIQGQAGTATSC